LKCRFPERTLWIKKSKYQNLSQKRAKYVARRSPFSGFFFAPHYQHFINMSKNLTIPFVYFTEASDKKVFFLSP